MNDKSLRETAERIIAGIPVSYRDGDEEAGRERTVNWLIDLLLQNEQRDLWKQGYKQGITDMAMRGEADTKRLDWLRLNWFTFYPLHTSLRVTLPFDLRKAIDAAIKEEK